MVYEVRDQLLGKKSEFFQIVDAQESKFELSAEFESTKEFLTSFFGILEDKAPGWELNEGSSGKFVINPIEKTIQFNLDVYEEQERTEEEYMYIYWLLPNHKIIIVQSIHTF